MVQRNHRAKRHCHRVLEYPPSSNRISPRNTRLTRGRSGIFPIPSKESSRSCVGEKHRNNRNPARHDNRKPNTGFQHNEFFSQQRHSKKRPSMVAERCYELSSLSHLSRNTRRTHFPRSNRHPCSNGHKGYCARSKSPRGTMEFKCQYTLLSLGNKALLPPSQYTTPGNIALRQRGIVRHRRQYLDCA